MTSLKFFHFLNGKVPLPLFFPDATLGIVKSLDIEDVKKTKTEGLLVNTYHLYRELGLDFIKKVGGIGKFMNWNGALISDSGGFQVGSLIKMNSMNGYVNNDGVFFKFFDKNEFLLTPEKSIEFQMELKSDMVIVLDDFTDPNASYLEAKISVDQTILWAKRCKDEFERICGKRKMAKNKRPLILGVVQGGYYQDLRRYCIKELIKIGFDGLGYGGWPLNKDNTFDYKSAKTIAKYSPDNYLLHGLGIGKPAQIVKLFKMGYRIFDCVLPTRDARHGRLYVYKADSIDQIDLSKRDFYNFLDISKAKYQKDLSSISSACDCLLCMKYSKSYLRHLFKIKDTAFGRLATIHNLRFYSILMEKLRNFV